jgi:Xaa-Pro aminopeptidase
MELAGMDCAIISRPEHIFYLTGFEAGHAVVFFLLGKQDNLLVAPASLAEFTSALPVTAYDTALLQPPQAHRRAALEKLGVAIDLLGMSGKSTGIETTHLAQDMLAVVLSQVEFAGDVGKLVEELRFVKDHQEIALIQRNQHLNDLAFEEVRYCLKPGMQELEVFQRIYKRLSQEMGSPLPWEGAIGSGLRSAFEDPKPDCTVIKRGDLLLVDIYTKFDRYYGDATRTFAAGDPQPWHVELHKILVEALDCGVRQLKPGKRACDVDAAIRKVIEKAGYGEQFPFYAGHGIGLWQTESPWIIPSDASELLPGCTIALEPGIYLAGNGGLRLENVYLVTENDPLNLTETESTLIIVK